MLMESWAIIVLLLIMAGIFFRLGKHNYAVMTLPLGAVPLARVCSGPISAALRGMGISAAVPILRAGVIGAGLVIAFILFLGLSKNAASHRARRAYVIVCTLFSACLLLVFMGDVLAL